LLPETCMVFEDTAVGAEAALKAGMHVYAVLNGLNSIADFDSLSVSGYIKDYEDLVNAAKTDAST
jgi:beta-phosphoglucomutase-like phosphatase (HAD superfamily)